jgi:hypothetical protein
MAPKIQIRILDARIKLCFKGVYILGNCHLHFEQQQQQQQQKEVNSDTIKGPSTLAFLRLFLRP